MNDGTEFLINFLLNYLNLTSCEFCEDGCEHCNGNGLKKLPEESEY